MPPLNVADEIVLARDGTRLDAFTAGGGPGPVIVLCNSLVGGVDAWRDLIEDFAPFHRVVGWRYRDLRTARGRSFRARGAREQSIEQHSQDLADVMAHFEARDVVLIGWSAGSRVVLHALTEMPADVRAAVLVCGLLNRPLRRLAEPFIGPLARAVPALGGLGGLAAELAPYAPLVWQLLGAGARSRTVADILRLIGAVSGSIGTQRLGELLADTMSLPLDRLLAMLRAVDAHVVGHRLRPVAMPLLIVGGSADPLCSPGDVAQAAALMPSAETMIVPSAGHLLPIEFAELLHLRIAKFIRIHCGFDRLAT